MTDKQYGAPDVAQNTEKPRRKRGQRILWIAGPLVLIVVGGWFFLTAGRYQSTDNAYVGADQANIAPQVAGRVVDVDVKENQPVHKGDVLFRIDPARFALSIKQLQAQMHAVGDFLASSRGNYAAAVADLHSQQSNVHNTLLQLKRIDDLYKKGLVSQKALDDATNDVAKARGDRDTAKANAAKARTMLGGNVDAPVDQLSGYKAIQAQLAKAQLDLDHTTVRAPFDGTIGKTHLQSGDFLQAGEKAMPLVATDKYVDANFKETDLTHVEVGQKAIITLDTYPDYTWHAVVASISPASGATFSVLPAQNATGNWVKVVQRIPVRLKFVDNQNAPVARVGMSAEVEIDTGRQNTRWRRWFGIGDDDAQQTSQHR